MPTLSFTISPKGLARFHDAISCLARFSETVSIEARSRGLCLSTINSTKSAYASFQFNALSFFDKYAFSVGSQKADQSGSFSNFFGCHILNKALLSVFRRSDAKNDDLALDRCEVELIDRPDTAACRFVIKMICRHGVVKIYKLTYELGLINHARYNHSSTQNHWVIDSQILREISEYFGPKTEHLDWSSEESKVTFTSYTEKISDGKEILRQPLYTSVTIETKDFREYMVQDGVKIGIMMKDFKAVISHANTARSDITANYSQPNRPLQLAYERDGMTCEFTLMTRLGKGSATSAVSTPARELSARPASVAPQNIQPTQIQSISQPPSEMPPPDPPTSRAAIRQNATQNRTERSPVRPSASLDPDSLFVPADDDQQWDEPKYDDEEDMIGWDASADNDAFNGSFARRIRDSEPQSTYQHRQAVEAVDDRAIPPTQRISQIQGLFD